MGGGGGRGGGGGGGGRGERKYSKFLSQSQWVPIFSLFAPMVSCDVRVNCVPRHRVLSMTLGEQSWGAEPSSQLLLKKCCCRAQGTELMTVG